MDETTEFVLADHLDSPEMIAAYEDARDYHYSSCALHNLPARMPMPCDCGLKADWVRRQMEVWAARWHWLRGKPMLRSTR